ncbi:MAG: MaoC/PaaZ C-terminal domain-containing protein [Paracoccaceae bacterium]
MDGFADLSGDDHWIHVDAARAAREQPGGKTIAHGLYLLSLIPRLQRQLFRIEQRGAGLELWLRSRALRRAGAGGKPGPPDPDPDLGHPARQRYATGDHLDDRDTRFGAARAGGRGTAAHHGRGRGVTHPRRAAMARRRQAQAPTRAPGGIVDGALLSFWMANPAADL